MIRIREYPTLAAKRASANSDTALLNEYANANSFRYRAVMENPKR
jgi:hypothetical protein